MADIENDEKTFKVQDRRTSSGGKDEPVQTAGTGKAKEAGPSKPKGTEDAHVPPGSKDRGVQQVDFSTFIFSLFSSALIQMGDMADPITGEMDRNLQAAKQTIDILDILAEKTEGNLSGEEANLLKNASAELKWKYLDAVKEKE